MLKLHLGCGPVHLKDFENIDIQGPVKLDLTQKLPYAPGSCDLIFSEHFIEHITRNDALQLLKECKRVLIPGGRIRITTPDLKILVNEYVNRRIDRWFEVWQPKTPAQMLNYGLTEWGHRFTYDEEELKLLFEEAGFTDPYLAKHGELEARGWSCEITIEAFKK